MRSKSEQRTVLKRIDQLLGEDAAVLDGPELRPGDNRDGRIYRATPGLRFAVKVAVTTQRPLLLTGAPGSGKSSLAPYLARGLGWRLYDEVVTGRTEAEDLLWRFDTVAKLAAARSADGTTLDDHQFIEPRALWWAIDPATAGTRGGSAFTSVDPNPDNADRRSPHAVVLIDEIDKADPDVPNALLVPLGSNTFKIGTIDVVVKSPQRSPGHVLTIITSNGERNLPPAFVRRCVAFDLPAPTDVDLMTIAGLHFDKTSWSKSFSDKLAALAVKTVAERTNAVSERRVPSTAEFLDSVRAATELKLKGDDPLWDDLFSVTIRKSGVRR